MSFITRIQKLRRVAIPPYVFKMKKLKYGDIVEVDVNKAKELK